MATSEEAGGSTLPLRKIKPAVAFQPRPTMVAKYTPKSRAKNACVSCQQNKKRCNEGRPKCSQCLEFNLDCTYSLKETARYKRAVARSKVRDYEAEIEKYENILEHIKNSSVSALQRVLSVIRGKAPLEDLMMFIRNDRSPSLPTEAILPEPATTDISLLMNDAWQSLEPVWDGSVNTNLIDDRPILNLPAQPWVTVVNDDEMVSHLMSLYMTWDHPVWNIFDFDIFIEAMKNFDTTYCSPLLVNAILAEACHYTNRITFRADPHNPNFLGYRFAQEAMRLWNEEIIHPDFQPSLVLAQSAFMLGITLAADGLDRLGGMFLNNGIRMVKDLLTLEQEEGSTGGGKGKESGKGKGKAVETSSKDQKYEYAKSITVWAAFNFQSMYDWVFKTPHTMSIPELPLPYLESTNPDDGHPPHPIFHRSEGSPFYNVDDSLSWRPYPWVGKTEPNVLRLGFQIHAKLQLILYDMTERQLANVKGEKLFTLAEKKSFYQQLDQFKNDIPEEFAEGKLISPSPSFVHIQYHLMILDIHSIPIKDEEGENEAELADFKLDSTNRYVVARTSLYKLFYAYNRKNSMFTMSQPLTYALLIAAQNALGGLAKAKDLSSATPSDLDATQTPIDPYDEDNITSTFENTLCWICHASNSFVTVKIFARIMHLEAQRMNLQLAKPIEEMLQRIFQWEAVDKSKWAEQMEKTHTGYTWGRKKNEANIVDIVKSLEEMSVNAS